MSRITDPRPGKAPISAVQSSGSFLAMAAARRAFIEAWATWIDEAQPSAAQVQEEADGTASAMRQIADFMAGRVRGHG